MPNDRWSRQDPLLVLFGDNFHVRDSSNHDFSGAYNKQASGDSEAWIAAVFFAAVGGFSWILGRPARSNSG
jgi:hypothetical protein